jgi:hypothetical protein
LQLDHRFDLSRDVSEHGLDERFRERPHRIGLLRVGSPLRQRLTGLSLPRSDVGLPLMSVVKSGSSSSPTAHAKTLMIRNRCLLIDFRHLKLDGNWRDAMKKSLAKKKPPGGWPKRPNLSCTRNGEQLPVLAQAARHCPRPYTDQRPAIVPMQRIAGRFYMRLEGRSRRR